MKVYLNLPTAALIPYYVVFSNILNHRTPKFAYLLRAKLREQADSGNVILNFR
jgi:hypothetical protein